MNLPRGALFGLDVVCIALVSLVAIGPRLVASTYDQPPQSEERLYNRYAVAWATGQGEEPRDVAFPWHPLGSFTHRPPGYALFMGAIYKVAGVENFAAVRTAQAWLDTASVALVYVLGALMFGGVVGRVTGLTAAVLIAGYDFQALMVGRLLSEPLFLFLCLAGLVTALGAARRSSGALAFLAAFLFGAATATRPFLLFLLPGYLLWIALAPGYPHSTWIRNRGRHLAAAALGMAVAIAPITYRNWQFHDTFILLSTNGGYTIWKGLVQTEGLTARQELGTEEEVDALGLGEVARSAEYQRRAVAYIGRYPLDLVPVVQRRLQILTAAKGGHVISHELMATPDDEWLWPLVMGLGLVGLVLMPGREWHARLLVFMAVGSQVAVSLLANAEVRYRLPIVPLVALFAAWAVWGLAARLTEGRRRKMGWH